MEKNFVMTKNGKPTNIYFTAEYIQQIRDQYGSKAVHVLKREIEYEMSL